MSAGAPSDSEPPGTPQNARRVHRQQLDQPRQRYDAGVHEAIEAERHGGLETGDAERRAVELDLLLVVVMRRVVGGDDVDAAVRDARRASRRGRPLRAAAGSSSRSCRTATGAPSISSVRTK